MKKLLLSFILFSISFVQGQNLYNYGFNAPTATMVSTDGWVRTNQSTSPSTTSLWSVGSYTAVTVSATVSATPFQNQAYTTGQTCPIPNGQDGSPNSFALVNYTSTSSTAATGATISNWLISPAVTVQNGDVVSFYTRIGKYSATGAASFADNLQLRMSTNGAFTANPSAGPTDVADYTNLLVEVNPNLDLSSYPTTWTQYTYTISGLAAPTSVNFAFRYYVTDGGVNGSNSDIIGIDTFSVDRPTASTDSFFKNNLSISPNPTKDVINITNINNVVLNSAVVTDVNGRTVKEVNFKDAINAQINISELNSGVYFLKVATDQGVGTSKVIKN